MTGAELVWRIGASFSLPMDQVLGYGTYLSRLKAPHRLRKDGAEDITVRIIEYRLKGEGGTVTETFTLITTLLDPMTAPARELAELYRARCAIETALGSPNTQMKGAGMVLRSKTPGGVIQEIWALLCACHAVREMISAAAALAREDQLGICFTSALDVACGPGRGPGLFVPLALLTGSAGPRSPSLPPSPPGPGRAGQTRARPSAAPGTRPGQPTRHTGRNPARHR